LTKGTWRNAVLVLGSLVFFAWVDFKNLHLVAAVYPGKSPVGEGDRPFVCPQQACCTPWGAVDWRKSEFSFLGFYEHLGFFDQILQRITPLNIPLEKPGLILGVA